MKKFKLMSSLLAIVAVTSSLLMPIQAEALTAGTNSKAISEMKNTMMWENMDKDRRDQALKLMQTDFYKVKGEFIEGKMNKGFVQYTGIEGKDRAAIGMSGNTNEALIINVNLPNTDEYVENAVRDLFGTNKSYALGKELILTGKDVKEMKALFTKICKKVGVPVTRGSHKVLYNVSGLPEIKYPALVTFRSVSDKYPVNVAIPDMKKWADYYVYGVAIGERNTAILVSQGAVDPITWLNTLPKEQRLMKFMDFSTQGVRVLPNVYTVSYNGRVTDVLKYYNIEYTIPKYVQAEMDVRRYIYIESDLLKPYRDNMRRYLAGQPIQPVPVETRVNIIKTIESERQKRGCIQSYRIGMRPMATSYLGDVKLEKVKHNLMAKTGRTEEQFYKDNFMLDRSKAKEINAMIDMIEKERKDPAVVINAPQKYKDEAIY